jgi:hypothetical protein
MSKTYISVELRRLVFNRAANNCEYCLIPEAIALASHQVDHIIAEKHGGQTIAENLALSCSLCNQAKGSDVAAINLETGAIVRLYHPRLDRWVEHFQMDCSTGQILGISEIGRMTAQLLQINREASVVERKVLCKADAIFPPPFT